MVNVPTPETRSADPGGPVTAVEAIKVFLAELAAMPAFAPPEQERRVLGLKARAFYTMATEARERGDLDEAAQCARWGDEAARHTLEVA